MNDATTYPTLGTYLTRLRGEAWESAAIRTCCATALELHDLTEDDFDVDRDVHVQETMQHGGTCFVFHFETWNEDDEKMVWNKCLIVY